MSNPSSQSIRKTVRLMFDVPPLILEAIILFIIVTGVPLFIISFPIVAFFYKWADSNGNLAWPPLMGILWGIPVAILLATMLVHLYKWSHKE